MSASGLTTSTYETLAAHYRAEVISKLPRRSILAPSFIASFPPGSDITSVPETCGVLSEREVSITRMNVVQLVGEMGEGRIKAVEVVEAFGVRAAIAHQLNPCLTDFFLEEALVAAQSCDEHFERTGTIIGPLHGIPISLKDQVQLTGKMTSLSFLSLHHEKPPARMDAQLAIILRSAGAIFFCHTTLPQAIMHLECESFWGITKNPRNTFLTSGGSSGGEGALLAMRGSPMGVGSDIGGSIRIPASFGGLYGLRPTAQRVPNAGCRTYVPGRDSILGTFGPICHTAEDVELFMNVVTGESASPWRTDPNLLEMPWGVGRNGKWEGGRKLRIGIMRDDGCVMPGAAIRELIEKSEQKLREGGEVEVVEFKPWKMREGWEIIRKLYFVDGGKRIRQLLNQEATEEPMHPLTSWLLDTAPAVTELDIHSLWELNLERDYYRAGFVKYWDQHDIDVLLCPVAEGPAFKLGEAKWWSYTSHFNLVDYPSIAFPLSSITMDSVEGKDYLNAPIGLQLVARRYHDEELMKALKIVERILKS